MVRLFNVYYPVRTIVLLTGEVVLICLSFLLALAIQFHADTEQLYLALDVENGFVKILGITALALFCMYYFDLYDLQRLRTRGETYFRLLIVLGTFSFLLAGLAYWLPGFMPGRDVLLIGISIVTLALLLWRSAYSWLIQMPSLREKVYVLGAGARAQSLVEALRGRPDLGMEVIGWAGAMGNGSMTRESMADTLLGLRRNRSVERVIVALSDRRGTMPVQELLDLRMGGVHVEEATGLMEKITGKIGVDDLNPSWLLFTTGFRLDAAFMLARRLISKLISLVSLVVLAPILPFIILAIKLTSPGPVLYSQKRAGLNGKTFNCYKFRTMRPDAEADTGPTWASDEDPRITWIGKWLRKTRLDEIPQFWNVLRGDMGFVGPRPERPEFVEWLSKEIPFYQLRHVIRPGITGWAQINYPYGASVEESKEKLQYDLYYIKNMSLALDLYIVLQTLKIALLGRGAK